MRLACAFASLALILPAGAAGSDGCPDANTPATSAPAPAMRSAVVCLINQERSERGLPILSVSPKLDSAAQRWAGEMVARGEFSHAGFTTRISATGYSWQTIGENIATGYASPREAVAAWMASPDHCRNILDPAFRNVGTGEMPDAVRGWASGPATWAQDFGLSLGQAAASGDRRPAARCPYR